MAQFCLFHTDFFQVHPIIKRINFESMLIQVTDLNIMPTFISL